MLMDFEAEPYGDIFGFTHGFDLDVMEQTIIDDVMAEISVNTTFPIILNCVNQQEFDKGVHEMSDYLLDSSVIEATDVSSLLEQFEEASQSLDPPSNSCDSNRYEITFHSGIDDNHVPETNVKMKSVLNILEEKPKTIHKPKSAVLLPMTVPAKRGRGRAMTRGHPVAMPTNCTPRSLQRIMSQNTILQDSLAKYGEHKIQEMKESVEKTKIKLNVEEKDVEGKSCQNLSHNQCASVEANKASTEANLSAESLCLDHDYVKGQFSNAYCDSNRQVEEYEEGELVDDDTEVDCRDKPRRDGCDKKQVEYFDKLPSYYTALSIPRKQIHKTASHAYGRGGIAVHDYIERPISPVHDSSAMSKVPDYFSTFTNSSKYDNQENENMLKFSNDSKTSSGYSSRSPSSSTNSRSPSKSRSRSRSLSSASRNCSISSQRSRSLTGRGRSKRKSQSASSSACSGYTSSSSLCCSGCSRSSCGRSRCSSSSTCSSGSRSRSGSVSTSRSHSRSSHHRSRSREISRERRLRPERSQERRSRSRSQAERSRHHRRSRRSVSSCSSDSLYSCRSRSPLVPRPSRDPSRERRREERRKQREEAKQKQMKERRIVYVGGIPRNYTRHQMRANFLRFGEIENVQLHFREHGDNYGFVTFAYTCDAFAAIEKGKLLPGLKNFDLCFGGRRQFCDFEYADLDGNKEVEEEYDPGPRKPAASLDFDEMLRLARANIKKS